MKIKKMLCILMTFVMLISSLGILSVTSFAFPVSGTKSCSDSSMGGYGKSSVKITLKNASEVSGNTATYYVDKYSMETYKDLENIYEVQFIMNGCILSTSIESTKLDLSNHYVNNNTQFGTENKLLTDTPSGYIVGDVGKVGDVTEFSITAKISVTFRYNSYILTDSCSATVNVRLVVVDTTELQTMIGTGDLYQSSCWSADTFESFTSVLEEAKELVDNRVPSKEDIDSMLSRLKAARDSLVHNGSITECDYCKSEKTGKATTPISYRDVVYGTDPERQCMDLFLPSNVTGDVSLILYLHGGGWRYGDKSEYTGRAYNHCLKYGVATLTISYRYTSESVTAFDILDDMASALAKAKELGAQHGLNIKQMMTYGGSAGGHLSLLYSYARQNTSPIQPVAAFSKCGPTNLTNKEYLDSNLGESTILYALGSMCGKYFTAKTMNSAYNELLAVSPVNYVNANTVPTVICHGMKDETVPFSDAKVLDVLLTDKGVDHYFLAYPNTNHAIDIGTDPEYVAYADRLFDQYVEDYLKNIEPSQVHDYEKKTVAKTCTSDGYTLYTCKICGEYHVSDIVKASHTPGEWTVVTAPTYTTEGEEVLSCSVCKTVLQTRTIDKLEMPYTEITAKDGSGLVINRENMFIENIEQGTTNLEELLDFKGAVIEYEETAAGFGTGTKLIVRSQATGEIMETFTLVFPGDVTGDGFADSFDVSVLSSVANFENEFEEDSAYMKAADLEEDGFVDSFDLSRLNALANFEF